MKAILMTAVGGPEVLELRDVTKPSIQRETEMLVKVMGAGLNPVDAKQRGRGTWYPSELPQVLGIDGAGIIEEAGPGVTRFKAGDEVYYACGGMGMIPGNYAEYIVIDEKFAALKPSSFEFTQAAAVPCALITAWESLFDHGGLCKGQTVLIHAGAGGVGHIAVQLAREKGARVCTTVSSDKKMEIVKKLGAEKVIMYRDSDFVEETLDWTDGKGVDVAFDLVGGETFFKTFSCVRFYGNVVTALGPSTDFADWKEARLRNIRVSFELMLTPMYYDLTERQERHIKILEEFSRMADQKKVTVLVNSTYPLKDVREAHRILQEGHTIGKIVLQPNLRV